ncbi:MAG: hypothetical protein DWQ02_28485 [Bacteroidetes bacterium]|nr:MAG: hypothetical protein DWQ02_28485 [Bacteroidota bacterium]
MPNNDQFKSVLHDAKLICRTKFNAVKAIHGENNTQVVNIQNELKSVYRQFDDPAVWSQVLAFDHTKIMNLILKVGIADPNDLANFIKVTTDLLNLLKDEVLKAPLEKISQMAPSDWNLKTLDALRLTNQRIAGRERYFKNHGQDLSQNAEFKQIDQAYDVRAAEYRMLLNSNGVQSNQTDVILITRFGEMMKQSTAVPVFLGLYKGLSDYVNSKIPRP